MELFENADVTASISLGITRGHVACLFSFIEVLMSNIVIEYQILLSKRILNVTAFSCGQGYF